MNDHVPPKLGLVMLGDSIWFPTWLNSVGAGSKQFDRHPRSSDTSKALAVVRWQRETPVLPSWQRVVCWLSHLSAPLLKALKILKILKCQGTRLESKFGTPKHPKTIGFPNWEWPRTRMTWCHDLGNPQLRPGHFDFNGISQPKTCHRASAFQPPQHQWELHGILWQ